jgi:hypothetical protein
MKVIILTGKQKHKLSENFEHRELATKFAKDYGIMTQMACDINELCAMRSL